MLTRIFLATLLVAGSTAGLNAQTPTNDDECYNSLAALQQSAADKKLSDDKSAKVEDLLTKMEAQCEAEGFADAAATAAQIKAVVGN